MTIEEIQTALANNWYYENAMMADEHVQFLLSELTALRKERDFVANNIISPANKWANTSLGKENDKEANKHLAHLSIGLRHYQAMKNRGDFAAVSLSEGKEDNV